MGSGLLTPTPGSLFLTRRTSEPCIPPNRHLLGVYFAGGGISLLAALLPVLLVGGAELFIQMSRVASDKRRAASEEDFPL